MPSVEGVEMPDPLKEYFGSVGNAIRKALEGLALKTNDPTLIMVPGPSGMRPLERAMSQERSVSGDLRATLASNVSARRRDGWVLCDGRNGTPDTLGAIALGALEASNPGVTIIGEDPIETSGATPDTTEAAEEGPMNVYDGCSGGGNVAVADHTHPHPHTHTVDIAANAKSFTVVWMMKL